MLKKTSFNAYLIMDYEFTPFTLISTFSIVCILLCYTKLCLFDILVLSFFLVLCINIFTDPKDTLHDYVAYRLHMLSVALLLFILIVEVVQPPSLVTLMYSNLHYPMSRWLVGILFIISLLNISNFGECICLTLFYSSLLDDEYDYELLYDYETLSELRYNNKVHPRTKYIRKLQNYCVRNKLRHRNLLPHKQEEIEETDEETE